MLQGPQDIIIQENPALEGRPKGPTAAPATYEGGPGRVGFGTVAELRATPLAENNTGFKVIRRK